MSKRVFISSTFKDLAAYREVVAKAIRQLGAQDVAMENFGARDERPKAECERLIREGSDVFVGIYAHRYGFVPAGETMSISEAEYEAATAARLPRLIYLLDDNHAWPPPQIERGAGEAKLQHFKDKLRAVHVCSAFTTADDLGRRVAADLGRFFVEGRIPGPQGHRGILHRPPAGWVAPVTNNPWRYKVLAFDWDGTLLRGDQFQFSWEAIWEALGFAHGYQTELKREYRQKTKGGVSREIRVAAYREWCEKACAQFMARRLTRAKLAEIVGPLRLTQNCVPVLRTLRQEGFVLAVISGGVQTFIEDKIPDFRDLFDYVFINELRFDAAGRLSDLVATEFDFEGKAEALEVVCQECGCTRQEAVFVGDGFNDEQIMLAADKAIAYPPKDNAVEGVAQKLIGEDNLELILGEVRVEA